MNPIDDLHLLTAQYNFWQLERGKAQHRALMARNQPEWDLASEQVALAHRRMVALHFEFRRLGIEVPE